MKEKTFLRKAALADRYQVGRRTVETWMSRGLIPYVRLGRVVLFDAAEVDQALMAFRHGAVAEKPGGLR